MNRYARHLLVLTLLLGTPVAAPAATLTTFDGTPAELDAYLGDGKWTLVKLWRSDCLVCNARAHEYVAFHARHHEVDARVLGISVDGLQGLAAAEAFVAQHRLNYPSLIIDWDGADRLFYGLTGTPLTGTPGFLLFSPERELIAFQVGAVPIDLIESFIGSIAMAR